MIKNITCFLVDVINNTLASCDYRECDVQCNDYLMAVQTQCPVVFNNEMYKKLWRTLYKICNDIGEQTSPFYLDE